MQVVIRLDARERRVPELACFPQQLALRLCRRRPHIGGAVLPQHPVDGYRPLLGLLAQTLDLHEEQRAGVRRKMNVERRVQRSDRHVIEHLHRGRHDTARDDRARRSRSAVDVGKDGDERPHVLGEGEQPQPDLRDDPERALAADDQRHAVVSRKIRGRPAESRDLAVRQNHLDPEHVVDHRAVSEGVRTARVGPDVPADGGDPLARGIGSEEESRLSRGDADREVRNAGLHDRHPRRRVDRDDAPEAHRRYDDRPRARDRPSGEPRPRSARHDRRARVVRRLHDCGHLIRTSRNGDRTRRMAIETRVVLPDQEILGPPKDVVVAADLLEPKDKRRRRSGCHRRGGAGWHGVARWRGGAGCARTAGPGTRVAR